MAIGFSPKYSELLHLNRLTTTQFFALAYDILKQDNWIATEISELLLIARTNNDKFSHNATMEITVYDGHAQITSTSSGSEMFDLGRNKKNVLEFITNFDQAKIATDIDTLTEQYSHLLTEGIPETDLETVNTNQHEASNLSFKSFQSAFIPVKGFFITPIIIYLNIIIFVIMVCAGVDVMEPNPESLAHWGANFRPLTTNGEWWRLLSACFLHAGLMHLVFNMLALGYIGALLEPRLGKLKFLSAYLFTGLLASSVSLWWNVQTISVGASGAIFGMYGIFLALLTTNFVEKRTRTALFSSIAIFVVYNLAGGLRDGIDNAAHVGGLISGIIIGYAMVPALMKPAAKVLNYISIAGILVLVILTSFAFSSNLEDDTAIYVAKMGEFKEMEALALEIYSKKQYLDQAEMLDEIKNRSDYYWNENLRLTQEISDLSIPNFELRKNKLVQEYCELHIRKNKIIYKAVNEKTTHYEAQLQEYDRKLKIVVDQIIAMQ